MFTNTYLPHVGGVARSVQFFSEDLIERGHQVLVVAPTYAGRSDSRGDRIRVVRVPAIQEFNGSDFSVRIPLPFTISQQIEQFSPHVVHSHHPFLLGDAAVRVARKWALPLVFTHHTRYERYTHYVPLDSDPLKNFVIGLSTAYANLCSRVVAPSYSLAELLMRRGVHRPIVEIPTGVDVSFFAGGQGEGFRRRHSIPADALVLGHVGRLAPEKNLVYLADAVASSLEEIPSARFLVAGNGPSEADIRKKFADRNMQERLHLMGELSGRQLRDAYSAMDLFVFSSKSETQGMVLVEAMAAGKPVIALDASGSREVVRDGENGRLLPRNASAQDFAAAIRRFRSGSELAHRWIDGARQTARVFSRLTCAQKLESLYSEALDEYGDHAPTDMDELGPLDTLAERIKTEWDLLSRKTGAVLEAVQSNNS
jgi:glycosyltransferase involved in cell wall biosynthesis